QDHELPKPLVNVIIHADIRCICTQIDGLLRDSVAYQDFSKARDDDAQQLLDLLQDLLDYPSLDSPIRPVIWAALLKLSKKSSRHPRCFALPDLQLTGPPVNGGAFADIWKTHFHNETVCVKVMRLFETVEVETLLKGFRKEAIIWRQLTHPNLLPFFGVYFLVDTRPRLCLVSPWMENGHIYNYLRSNPAGINRLTLVLDVAIGLEHLHSLKLVHGDLKAINVLVTRSGRAVLADFGLSSVVMDSKIPALSSSVHSGGTTRWLAPEVLHGNRNSVASDVYAFACVCYEIFTGKIPFFEVSEHAVVMHVVNGNLPQKLSSISDAVWPLMEECWGTEPGKRPMAQQIVARLGDPPIGATPTNAASDWEPLYTSKFRSSLQDHTLFHFMRQD
ncbi:kinase-like domain-containing protein, partial [Mycena leptocephala]